MIPDVSQFAVLLVDLQPSIVDVSSTVPAESIRFNAGVLVQVATVRQLPMIFSAVPMNGFNPDLVEEIGTAPTFVRNTVGALEDPHTLAELKATRRSAIILGGVVTEVAVLHAALGAIRAGFEVYVAVDLCGGISERTEAAAFDQIRHAGGVVTSVVSLIGGFGQDFRTAAGQTELAAMRSLLKSRA